MLCPKSWTSTGDTVTGRTDIFLALTKDTVQCGRQSRGCIINALKSFNYVAIEVALNAVTAWKWSI